MKKNQSGTLLIQDVRTTFFPLGRRFFCAFFQSLNCKKSSVKVTGRGQAALQSEGIRTSGTDAGSLK
ncbi:MAG: hypothetical protein A2010_18960 [Nitrospirae bacterium GWD2_57_9]|nr:MAG: hypothetical protein A2010_18960 [Nitrospirae bacterium GWD2_57_9]